MTYDVFDSTGNLIESFDDEGRARDALERFARMDMYAAEHLALIVFDDGGSALGDPVFPETASARE